MVIEADVAAADDTQAHSWLRPAGQLADCHAPVGRIGAGRLAYFADVQVAVLVDGNAMRRDEADPVRRILAPARLHLAIEIQHRDARGSVLTPRRRHERK